MSGTSVISLDDKYRLASSGKALISGRQVLVRLPLAQRELDRRAGLNTAGFISGYRGSPLGGFDAELWKASDLLTASDITFQPGLNEDLAMTSVAGTQQIGFLPGQKVEGVFGLWYGKGPGVDRSGDAIKHANLAGVSPAGGILLIFGDDHAGKSSTTAHQSDLTLASWEVPILYPSTLAEVLEFGLAGIAMSRFSGALVALKLVNETAEATGVLDLAKLPTFVVPDMPGNVHIRPEVRALQEQDARLFREKLPRAQTFARSNWMDRVTYGAKRPRFLIATAGKAYADVLGALQMLGLDDSSAERAGIGVFKIALLFPLDPIALSEATSGAQEVFFVEEKRAHAETQAKAHFCNRAERPIITGKFDDQGEPLLASDLPLDALAVALSLGARLKKTVPEVERIVPGFAAAYEEVRQRLGNKAGVGATLAIRRPGFCAGCPHNSSTKVPEGSFGATGIGCHGMVLFHPDRKPIPMVHMGAEGANWIGIAPYTQTDHIFQNLGDGTYSHSGSLAIRAAVVAGVNITYKILYNDAVAMTGGQAVEGSLTVGKIVRQVSAEGVGRVVVVSDHPERFGETDLLPAGTELRHRDDLQSVQEQLRAHDGVSVLVYDQVCAAEKRRRRKIDAFPNPDKRIFINADVCEGCGDCSVQSNCTAIQPLETAFGRKRRIDQSACNKDYSCVKGFCPSFVIVEGGRPRRSKHKPPVGGGQLPEPALPKLGDGFDMIVTGVGGTGVVTVGALIGMAARIEGYGASLYDMTGLSQKGGAVFSHVRLRENPNAVMPARLGPSEADLVLAGDLIAAVHPEVATTIAPERTLVVGNSDIAATADFQIHRDLQVPDEALRAKLATLAGRAPALLPATRLSEELFGDSIAANILMLGFAWQRGAIPLKLESIEQAIRLNGRAVEANLEAFAAGRRVALEAPAPPEKPQTLDDFVKSRTADLLGYWNEAYAERYAALIAKVGIAAAEVSGGEAFAWAVARSAYKLMAYKDEYEVARLYSDPRFHKALHDELEGISKVSIMLSPPLLARIDPATGRPRKISVGSWIFPIFRVLAACRKLRESPVDLFARTAERRLERALRDRFIEAVAHLAAGLNADNLADAIALAQAPMQVRGFGFVKAPGAEALLATLESARS